MNKSDFSEWCSCHSFGQAQNLTGNGEHCQSIPFFWVYCSGRTEYSKERSLSLHQARETDIL